MERFATSEDRCDIRAHAEAGLRRGSGWKQGHEATDRCCSNCFEYADVKAFVRKNGTRPTLPCFHCGSARANQIQASDLEKLFWPLVTFNYLHFGELSQAPHEDAFDSGETIGQMLQEDYEAFSEDVIETQALVAEILAGQEYDPREGDGTGISDLWVRKEHDWTHRPVGDDVDTVRDGVAAFGHSLDSVGAHKHWDRIELDGAKGGLRSLLKGSTDTLPAGSLYWRARVGEYPVGKVCAPPPDRAIALRANGTGQPTLYVANKPETALSEVRPALGERVTLAKLRLERPVTVASLIGYPNGFPSPFTQFEEYRTWLRFQDAKQHLGAEFAAPVRRSDEARDYLFTQYVANEARRLGLDGLAYGSAQGAGGVNYAFFDPGVATGVGQVRVLEVNDVQYKTERVKRGKDESSGSSGAARGRAPSRRR